MQIFATNRSPVAPRCSRVMMLKSVLLIHSDTDLECGVIIQVARFSSSRIVLLEACGVIGNVHLGKNSVEIIRAVIIIPISRESDFQFGTLISILDLVVN